MMELLQSLMPSIVAGAVAAGASWAFMKAEIRYLKGALKRAFESIDTLHLKRENHELRLTIIEAKQDGTITHRI